jgi:hypothetical protein
MLTVLARSVKRLRRKEFQIYKTNQLENWRFIVQENRGGFRGLLVLTAAFVCVLLAAGGCGLLGINLIPESTITSVQFYTVPFLCESNAAGELVQSSFVIVHNPEADRVTIYRRAVLVGLETDPLPEDVVWSEQILTPDQAVRLDCDAFARILTDDANATFNSEFPPGSRVDGFLTLGIEAGGEVARLDTSVQYMQPDGSFTIAPIVPSLVVVEAWPPSTTISPIPN